MKRKPGTAYFTHEWDVGGMRPACVDSTLIMLENIEYILLLSSLFRHFWLLLGNVFVTNCLNFIQKLLTIARRTHVWTVDHASKEMIPISVYAEKSGLAIIAKVSHTNTFDTHNQYIIWTMHKIKAIMLKDIAVSSHFE